MKANSSTNYNWDNINEIEELLNGENMDNTYLKKTHTLIQTNSSNPVEKTSESRKECARLDKNI